MDNSDDTMAPNNIIKLTLPRAPRKPVRQVYAAYVYLSSGVQGWLSAFDYRTKNVTLSEEFVKSCPTWVTNLPAPTAFERMLKEINYIERLEIVDITTDTVLAWFDRTQAL